MQYKKPDSIQAVIFDWAGTTVDFGSFAPTQIFVEAFAEFGISLSLEEARGPMGMGKWDHIRTLCNTPAIAARWKSEFGRLPDDGDVSLIYKRFMPLQIDKIGHYSALIPGVLEVIKQLRQQNIRIGSCSGYPAVVMEKVVALAKNNGYEADCVVATDDVPNGRPWPAQSLQNAIQLGVSDVAACVKVDDTIPGLLEGRSAGMWTVALLMSGNALGLNWEAYQALTNAERSEHRARIHAQLMKGGAHYYIDIIDDLPEVITTINQRLARGESPQSA
ncbi:phosphonoacetaldehyde hydrolase [Salmonella enterica subsp. enterica serovar Oslo]|nr:phosphonoacetaldehyde hydrolase [Salmonella enterica subsp. enterica serovar Oslo]ECZ6731373.1 phosphonoacetaldehyde hydrolase [Salmonella enterica]EDR2105138.1 phosphonoacetaldehyde hydrolase [Salmonella enterica subsp. enterica]EGZ4377609.1 phosphonoacetaldehyde hydrolase [Salmonella enterica subsp. enterica serovar Lexington]ECG6798062.1 phosphonoacetaldehyde hydrolase [Salmonella enterica subsp. enterica serovar Oslo]